MAYDPKLRGLKTQFQPGNTESLKHGGERSIEALSHGTSLVGIARQLETQVRDEIEVDGLLEVMRRRAIRHLAVSDLFYSLVLGAEDLETLDKYTKRFGWLSAKAYRMLESVRRMEREQAIDDPGVVDYEKILAEQRANDTT